MTEELCAAGKDADLTLKEIERLHCLKTAKEDLVLYFSSGLDAAKVDLAQTTCSLESAEKAYAEKLAYIKTLVTLSAE